jgi:hypothetical protein
VVASTRAAQLSLEDERRVRLARLCEAMRDQKPPALANPPFHLYSDEKLFAIRRVRRLEYFGHHQEDAWASYWCFGHPLFRPGGATGLVYLGSLPEAVTQAIPDDWHQVGGGLLHLTNWRLVFQSNEGDWLDFPFEMIGWSECFSDGIGIWAQEWSPMYFSMPYPEWLYGFFCFFAYGQAPQVPIARELDWRARRVGM